MEKHFELCLRSGSAIIWLSSLEEDRSVLRLKAAAEKLGYMVFDWDCIQGFQQLSKGDVRQPGDGQCTNIGQALRATGEYKHSKAVFIFRDMSLLADRLERSAEYVSLVREVKQLYHRLKKTGNTVVFGSASPTEPQDLKDCLSLVEASLPNQEERLAITRAWIETNCHEVPCDLDDEVIHHLVSASAGMTSRQIQTALAVSAVKRKGLTPDSVEDMLAEKVAVVKTSEVLDYVRVEETLDSVGGLVGIKDFLVKRSLAFGPAAARYGLPTPKGILILGPPGTGKSLIAKATASVFQVPLLGFDIGRVQGSLVGQSEERMRLAIALAESQAPCVLWLDELEKAFGGVSGPAGDSGVLQRQFGYLLNWMQEHNEPVFMVATANNIRQLPPEFLRKGRFDEIFFVDLPTPSERKEILRVLLRKRGYNPKGLVKESLVNKLEHYTGAEMEYVIIEALYEAFYDNQRPLRAKDLEEATTRIIPIADQMRGEIEELRRWGKVNARAAG